MIFSRVELHQPVYHFGKVGQMSFHRECLFWRGHHAIPVETKLSCSSHGEHFLSLSPLPLSTSVSPYIYPCFVLNNNVSILMQAYGAEDDRVFGIPGEVSPLG